MHREVSICLLTTILLPVAGALAAPPPSAIRVPYGKPTDLSPWISHREQTAHPVGLIKPGDLERARRNIATHAWAAQYAEVTRLNADKALAILAKPDFLTNMVEVTTAGNTSPCPACRDKGLRWLPNNVWRWSAENPDQITCSQCDTVFPNANYPETVVLTSTWDPRQVFRFVEGPTFHCFGYRHSRANPAGIIRARKLGYVLRLLEPLSTAYALHGNPEHAAGVRAILLRLADVVPTYLVRAGYTYNEYADCDPHLAASNILDLPTDELVVPPNVPDRKLWTGFWSASRFGTAGMDGGIAVSLATAYDLTCTARLADGKPVYSDEDRLRIEKDVLLETAYLALCDTLINNKSVGNRAGAAVVGLVTGHPLMVRFGLDGFQKTVDEWFLPDGGTSESAAYAMMTMGCIAPFAYAFRGYTEPAGFTPPEQAPRLTDFNACRDTEYGGAWQALTWTMQGDLRFPPLADSYVTTGISAVYAELIALGYPTPEHLALAQAKSGDNPTGAAARSALFYREPAATTADGAAIPTSPTLPDVVFPFLSQGFLRLGEFGRDGLAVLDASGWGGHHHLDSLNLYLWKDGHELLSDLGYLWDHPDKKMTTRTMAHNLVLIDGDNQKSQGRGGSFAFYAQSPRLKAMRASSAAYDAATTYERTVVQIDHGALGAYWLDVFRAQGGERRDYLFHGPSHDYVLEGATCPPPDPDNPAAPRNTGAKGPWKATWKITDAYRFAAYSPGHPGETLLIADEWGQRNHRNNDRGATLPYFFRRRTGDQLDAFVQVFAGFEEGRELVQSVTVATPREHVICIEVTHAGGRDIILLGDGSRTEAPTAPAMSSDAVLAIVAGLPAAGAAAPAGPAALLLGGTELQAPGLSLTTARAEWSGRVSSRASRGGDSWFELDGPVLPAPDQFRGQALIVTGDDGISRAYPVRRAEITA
ncbi:MAG: heparinase II/III family protein, partial [Lentisphaeria bacterium]|nr:heparinase II/III family protein [Lentisphaeria bacterium]